MGLHTSIMQHMNKANRNNKFYYRGPPPSLASPGAFFSFADKQKTGYLGQQDIINAINSHLRPSNHHEQRFIFERVLGACKACNVYTTHKIDMDGFLRSKMDKRLLKLEQDYNKTFKSRLSRSYIVIVCFIPIQKKVVELK